MSLSRVTIGIAGRPAFMEGSDTVRNSYQQRAVQTMFCTECLNALNGVFNTVQVSHDQRPHLRYVSKPMLLNSRVFLATVRTWLAAFSSTDMRASFRRKLCTPLPRTHTRPELSRELPAG